MITIYSFTYNEELIIQQFIDHYRKAFPGCTINFYDNYSTDNTVKIALDNNCNVQYFGKVNEYCEITLTHLRNNCWKKSNTDWVAVCDCDELVDINIHDLIKENILGSSILLFEGYHMINMNQNNEYNYSKINYGIRDTVFDKSYVFNKKYIQEINYDFGSHNCKPIAKNNHLVFSNHKYRAFHFKYLGETYTINKYSVLTKRKNAETRSKNLSFHYDVSEQYIKNLYLSFRTQAKKIIFNNSIHVIVFIKNEEKFIEAFIQYHQKIADKITIIDNGSTDNTLNIITKYLNDNIFLIIDNSSFNNKGNICTKQIQDSDADIIVPLDADEFLLYDNGSIIEDDPKIIREYLKTIPIDGHKYKINKVYNKIENTNNYSISKTYNSNKIIFPKLGFVETDCGFHFGKVLSDDSDNKIYNIDISYLHLHYLSKERWLKSCHQKLKARLQDKFNNLDSIIDLAGTTNRSNHIAKEMIYYLATNKWHNLKNDVSFETPLLTSLLQRDIIPS